MPCKHERVQDLALLSRLLSHWILAWLILQPWRWKHCVAPKCWFTYSGLYGTISEKIECFMNLEVWMFAWNEYGIKFQANHLTCGPWVWCCSLCCMASSRSMIRVPHSCLIRSKLLIIPFQGKLFSCKVACDDSSKQSPTSLCGVTARDTGPSVNTCSPWFSQ